MSESQQQAPFALRSIYIRRSNMHMAEDFDPLVPGQTLHALFRTNQKLGVLNRLTTTLEGKSEPSAIFIVGFEFRYTRKPVDIKVLDGQGAAASVDDGNLIAEITAEIAIDYKILTEATPPGDAMQNWGNTSALLHVWPYWREYCHSAMVRMNLPVTLMPMLHIPSLQPMLRSAPDSTEPVSPIQKNARRSKMRK